MWINVGYMWTHLPPVDHQLCSLVHCRLDQRANPFLRNPSLNFLTDPPVLLPTFA